MLFTKVVSSNNGRYYLSLYLAHAPWIRKAAYQFMVGKIQDFRRTQKSHRESVCQCGLKRDQGDHNFISQSKPSQYANIDRHDTVAGRNFAFGFTFLASDCWGQQGIVVFDKVRHWEEK